MRFWFSIRITFSIVLLFAITGCDFVSGVDRQVTVQTLPPRSCIEAALRVVPEVSRFEYTYMPPTTAWSFRKGTIHIPGYDRFIYYNSVIPEPEQIPYRGPDGEPAAGVVEVKEDAEGKKTLRLYYLRIGPKFKRDFINQVQAVMDKVYAGIRTYDPQVPPPEQVHETLIRIRD